MIIRLKLIQDHNYNNPDMEDNTKNRDNQNHLGEEEMLMDHNYDGIQELDNPPPRWIMAIFYITIAFAIIYAAYFFLLGVGDNQDAKYAKKSLQHDSKYKIENQSTDELLALTDAADLEEGQAVYKSMNCFACHGMVGEGNAVGPNLCDEYAINGGDFKSVFSIIKNGKPIKGMTAFKGQMSDKKIQQVASYVMSLVGTNPANAKGPQGDKVE